MIVEDKTKGARDPKRVLDDLFDTAAKLENLEHAKRAPPISKKEAEDVPFSWLRDFVQPLLVSVFGALNFVCAWRWVGVPMGLPSLTTVQILAVAVALSVLFSRPSRDAQNIVARNLPRKKEREATTLAFMAQLFLFIALVCLSAASGWGV